MQTGLSGGFCTDVFCDLIDIIHEPHGVSEGIGIDILNQEGFFPAVRQTEVYLVGVVDIACLDGFVTKISIFNAEEPTYLLQFLIQIQNKSILSRFSISKRKMCHVCCAAAIHILFHFTASGDECQSNS